MDNGQYKLSLVIDAATKAAETKIAQLEARLRSVGARGGAAGLGASFGLGGLRGLQGIGSTLGMATRAFGVLGTAGRLAFTGLLAPIKLVTGMVSGAFTGALRVAKLGFAGLAAAAGAAVGGVYATLKALGPAAYRESAGVSWEVMTGSKGEARERQKFLGEFNAKTPFNYQELDQGARLLETYGLYSKRTLRIVGDAVSAFGKRIEDAVGPLAKLRQGLFESESLALIGITRESLSGQGVKFGKQGELQTPGVEAYEAALNYLDQRFGGLMGKVAKTWKGLMSTLSANWDELWAALGKRPLQRLKPVLNELIGTFGELTVAAKDFDLPWLDKLTTGARMARELIRDLGDKEKRAELTKTVKESFGQVPEFLKNVANAAMRDLGTILGNFVRHFGSVTDLLGQGIAAAFRFGASLLREVLAGMGKEMGDRLNPLKRGQIANAESIAASAGVNYLQPSYRERIPAKAWIATSVNDLAKELARSDIPATAQNAAVGVASARLHSEMGWQQPGGSAGLGTAAVEESSARGLFGQAGKVALDITKGATHLNEVLWGEYQRDDQGNVKTGPDGKPLRKDGPSPAQKVVAPLKEKAVEYRERAEMSDWRNVQGWLRTYIGQLSDRQRQRIGVERIQGVVDQFKPGAPTAPYLGQAFANLGGEPANPSVWLAEAKRLREKHLGPEPPAKDDAYPSQTVRRRVETDDDGVAALKPQTVRRRVKTDDDGVAALKPQTVRRRVETDDDGVADTQTPSTTARRPVRRQKASGWKLFDDHEPRKRAKPSARAVHAASLRPDVPDFNDTPMARRFANARKDRDERFAAAHAARDKRLDDARLTFGRRLSQAPQPDAVPAATIREPAPSQVATPAAAGVDAGSLLKVIERAVELLGGELRKQTDHLATIAMGGLT